MPAQNHHHDGDRHKGEVPEDVENDDGLGVGPVAAALLEVRGGSLADNHRGLAHHAAAAGAAEERGGVMEGLVAEVAAGGGGGGGGEKGGGVGRGGW